MCGMSHMSHAAHTVFVVYIRVIKFNSKLLPLSSSHADICLLTDKFTTHNASRRADSLCVGGPWTLTPSPPGSPTYTCVAPLARKRPALCCMLYYLWTRAFAQHTDPHPSPVHTATTTTDIHIRHEDIRT